MKLLLSLVAFAATARADIYYENELIRTTEIFDLDYALDSSVWAYDNNGLNASKYYCVFRSNWNPENHPAEFPKLARWGNPVLFSHTKQYVPYIKNRAAPIGVETIAEVGFTEEFFKEIDRAGDYVVGDSVEAKGFFVNQKKLDENYVYLPPLTVTPEYSFISGIASFLPSPDWYSGFYLFETIKEQGQTYWQSFKIRTYPWDSGTDDGTHYEDPDRDTEPPGVVQRIELGDTQDNILLSPEGNELRYLAEWECVLHTCPAENPDCEKPNWPPQNGCDILRFPECAEICDPEVMECEQCKRTSESEPRVFHKDCCMAGRKPKNGRKCENQSGNSGAATVSITTATLTAALLGLAVLL